MERIKNHINFIILYICLVVSNSSFSQTFKDVSIEKGINTYAGFLDAAVAVIDFDNDGWEDLLYTSGYAINLKGQTKLYKNINGLSFQDVTISSGIDSLNKLSIYTTGVSVGDIDNDGDKDVIFATFFGAGGYNGKPLLYENIGNGSFIEIKNAFQLNEFNWGASVSFGDVNLDGYLDVYFGNYTKSSTFIYDNSGNEIGYIPEGLPNKLYINNRNKTFTDFTSNYNCENLGATYSSIFTDIDDDNDVDLLVGNDFGEWNGPFGIFPNAIYKNNFPQNNFSKLLNSTNLNQKMYCMGIAAGDFDNDLNIDYYFTNIGKNYLMKKNINSSFTDIANIAGVADSVDTPNGLKKTNWGCLFLDIDNDENLDLYVNSGWFQITLPNTLVFDQNKLFSNNGNGTFKDITSTAGIGSTLSHRGCAQFDFNHDGKLDIASAVANIAFPTLPVEIPHSFLFENKDTNTNNYLNVKLVGIKCNKDAYGSKIIIYYTQNKHQIREISGGGDAHCSISSSVQHFGLGNTNNIDSIRIFWLGGNTQKIENVIANQTLIITEDTLNNIVTNTANSFNVDVANIYPTIVSDISYISFNKNINIKNVQIINSNAQMVYDFTFPNIKSIQSFNELYFNKPAIPNGIYFIKIQDEKNNSRVYKIIISK